MPVQSKGQGLFSLACLGLRQSDGFTSFPPPIPSTGASLEEAGRSALCHNAFRECPGERLLPCPPHQQFQIQAHHWLRMFSRLVKPVTDRRRGPKCVPSGSAFLRRRDRNRHANAFGQPTEALQGLPAPAPGRGGGHSHTTAMPRPPHVLPGEGVIGRSLTPGMNEE